MLITKKEIQSKMTAITIYQPWASLIIQDKKHYETRSWITHYRGNLAIHAGAKKPSEILKIENINILRRIGCALCLFEETEVNFASRDRLLNALNSLPRSAILGYVNLTECCKIWDGQRAGYNLGTVCIDQPNQYWSPNWLTTSDEYLFGDWNVGRYAWKVDNTIKFSDTIPAKGKQRLWKWEDS